MMAKSGKLSYTDLIGALVVKDKLGVPKKLTAGSLLKMTNIGYLESLIGSIVRGKVLPKVNSKIVSYEETFFKNEIFKTISIYLNSWDDRKIEPFVEQLICALFPPSGLFSVASANLAISKLTKERSEIEQILWLIYRIIFINVKLDLSKDIGKLQDAVRTTTVTTPDPVKYPNAKKRFTRVILPSYSTSIEH